MIYSGLDESSVSKYVSELIQKEVIHGSCTAKEYVPEMFKRHQRIEVDEYFKLYGVVELNKLTSAFKVIIFSSSSSSSSSYSSLMIVI